MDIRKIKKLIELLEESSLTEIEIQEGEESVRLVRGGQVQNVGPSPPFGAATALICGISMNFDPFGHEPVTTGGKRKPG